MPIKEKRVFAIDVSGSTGNCSFYHSKVTEIREEMYRSGDYIIIWDDKAKKISYTDMESINNRMDGFGGTYPQVIPPLLRSEFPSNVIDHLILITDGQISSSDIDKLDRDLLNYPIKFKKVTVYIIGPQNEANLSVSCPFTRYCEHKIYQFESEDDYGTVINVSQKSIDAVSKINTISKINDFMNEYNSIANGLIARFIGSNGDKVISTDIIKMGTRIADNSKKALVSKEKNNEIKKYIANNDLDSAYNIGKQLYDNPKSEYEKKMFNLINISDGGMRAQLKTGDIIAFKKSIGVTDDNEQQESKNYSGTCFKIFKFIFKLILTFILLIFAIGIIDKRKDATLIVLLGFAFIVYFLFFY